MTSNIAPELTERTPVDDLREHPDNYNQGVINLIADSLRVHGMVRPILVSVGTPGIPDGTIIAGAHTWKAAKSLDWDEVATTYRSFPSEDYAVRYLVADNETARAAAKNREKLKAILDPIAETTTGDILSGTGVSEEEYQDLADELAFAAQDPGEISAQHSETDEQKAARDKSGDYEGGKGEPMVEAMLVLTRSEHVEFVKMIDALKAAWDVTSAKAVILRAVTEAHQTEDLHEKESQGAV